MVSPILYTAGQQENGPGKSGLQTAGLFWKLRFHKDGLLWCQGKPWKSGKFLGEIQPAAPVAVCPEKPH
jgi:hypothetical protein